MHRKRLRGKFVVSHHNQSTFYKSRGLIVPDVTKAMCNIESRWQGNSLMNCGLLALRYAGSSQRDCQINPNNITSTVYTNALETGAKSKTDLVDTVIGAWPSYQDGERFLIMSLCIKQLRHGANKAIKDLGVPTV